MTNIDSNKKSKAAADFDAAAQQEPGLMTRVENSSESSAPLANRSAQNIAFTTTSAKYNAQDREEILRILKLCGIEEENLEKITNLNLAYTGISGIPRAIGLFIMLINLKALNLSNNRFEILPAKIGGLKKLQKLDLSRNEFTNLPAEIGRLDELNDLNLSHNELANLPPEIGGLNKLNYLDLGSNQLTELLPEIGKLKKLTKLDLRMNQLTKLPREIVELINLKKLDLGSNQITELLPEIGELGELKQLDLGGNGLTNLPSTIRKLIQLECLILSHNKLTSLPHFFGEIPLNCRVSGLTFSNDVDPASIRAVVEDPNTLPQRRNQIIMALRETNSETLQALGAEFSDLYGNSAINSEIKKLNLKTLRHMMPTPLETLSSEYDKELVQSLEAILGRCEFDAEVKVMDRYKTHLKLILENLFQGAEHPLTWKIYQENAEELKNAFRHILKKFQELDSKKDPMLEIPSMALVLIEGFEHCQTRQASEINQVVAKLLGKEVSQDNVEKNLGWQLTQQIIALKEKALDDFLKDEKDNVTNVHFYQRVFTTLKNHFGLWAALQGFNEKISAPTETDRAQYINGYLVFFNTDILMRELGDFLKKQGPRTVHPFVMTSPIPESLKGIQVKEERDGEDPGTYFLQEITGNKNLYDSLKNDLYPVTDPEVAYILEHVLCVVNDGFFDSFKATEMKPD